MSSGKSKNSWSDPDTAMRFRGIIRTSVENMVSKLRPEPQYGTVLNVYRGGAEFRVGSKSAPEGPPAEGPGNPRQVYYASVRLDTSEVVTARVHENIPVFRPAAFYDQLENEGSTEPYLIADDQYRRRVVVQRVNESGQTYDSVEPETAHMAGPPFVPPRVMIEGRAGKYILARIIRGMSRLENVVVEKALQVSPSRYYNHELSTGVTELRPITNEFNTQYQGFIGNVGWASGGTFEVEIANGDRYQRFTFSTLDVTVSEWNNWYVVPATFSTSGHKDVGFPSNESNQALFAYLDSSGILFLYVATRNIGGLSVDSGYFLGGSVTLRAINRTLEKSTSSFLPSTPLVQTPSGVWGKTRSNPLITNVIDYAPVGSVSPFTANLQHMQLSLAGGGTKRVEMSSDNSKIYFRWSKRFLCMTSKTPTNTAGFANIEMPPVGTEIRVVSGNFSDGGVLPTRPVTSQGIDMSGWAGLYYALPLGQSETSQPGNFVIVLHSGWFDIPDHWMLIARRVFENGHSAIRLGSGQEIDVWRTWASDIPGMSAATNFEPAVTKTNNIVFLSGGVNITSAQPESQQSTNTPIYEGYRPYRRWRGSALYLSPSGSPENMRFDVFPNGDINFGRTLPSGSSVYFDQVTYPAGN